MKKLILFIFFIFITSVSHAVLVTEEYITPDDVTITHLESDRENITDAVNNFDGTLIQAASVPATALDADANPHNRWNEAFNDFVYTGLTVPTSASLSSTTTAGTAYINGVRVVKDATSKTYTASRWTFLDLSDSGVYTYQAVTIGSSEPTVASNSIRLGRVSTDSTTVLSVRDDRVTGIQLDAGGVTVIGDADEDTRILMEQSDDEDVIRFRLGDTTLSTPQEVLTLQAADTTHAKLEPTTDNFVDLGSSGKNYRNIWTKVITADSSVFGTADINGGTMDGVQIGGTTATGELIVNDSNDDADGLGSQGTSGQVLTSAGAGANPTWNTPQSKPISVTSVSAATTSGAISIAASKTYKVIVEITLSSNSTLTMTFNGDGAGNDYQTIVTGVTANATEVETHVGSTAANNIVLYGGTEVQSPYFGEYTISTSSAAAVWGNATHKNNSTELLHVEFSGYYTGGTPASFEIVCGVNYTGTIYLYELDHAL